MAIRLFVMDVDGTLTDGKIYIGAEGEIMKAFNVKDGLQIKKLQSKGVRIAIITGRNSKIVENRAKELNIDIVFQGINDKLESLKIVQEELNLQSCEIAYIGDDENDIPCLEYCGFGACPHDANSLVKSKAKYVCSLNGGEGAVAEYIGYLIVSGNVCS